MAVVPDRITGRSIDITSPGLDAEIPDELVGEPTIPCSDLVVAYRRGAGWVQTLEPSWLHASDTGAAPQRPGGST